MILNLSGRGCQRFASAEARVEPGTLAVMPQGVAHAFHRTSVQKSRKPATQGAVDTPRAEWNPDIEQPVRFFEDSRRLPEDPSQDNVFKAPWELFQRHVESDEPFRWTLLEGAKGVQPAENGLESPATSPGSRWARSREGARPRRASGMVVIAERPDPDVSEAD